MFTIENLAKNIVQNILSGILAYDEKYDEFKFVVEDPEQTVRELSFPLRMLFYIVYAEISTEDHKLHKILKPEYLIEMMDSDDECSYILNAYIECCSKEYLQNRVFKKPIEDDYRFMALSAEADRLHFRFKYPIYYKDNDGGKYLNFDRYLRTQLISLEQCSFAINQLDKEFVITYINENDVTSPDITDKLTVEDLKLVNADIRKKIINERLRTAKEPVSEEYYLENCDLPKNYHHFSNKLPFVNSLSKSVLSIIDTVQDKTKREMIAHLTKEFFNDALCKHIIEQKDDLYMSFIPRLASMHYAFTHCLLERYPSCTIGMINYMLSSNIIMKYDELIDILNRYHSVIENDEERFTIGFNCVRYLHCEPPLFVYPNPQMTYDNSIIMSYWGTYINKRNVPQEMSSMKYYDYMVRSNGVKRNPNQTIMYSYFSNSNENKLVFCPSNVELEEPARARYYIPVEFSMLKQFLHEELDTNDICMFTQLTKDDWNKIACGNDSIDVVVFNDVKNIYRERTKLADIIDYIINSIMIKFLVTPTTPKYV